MSARAVQSRKAADFSIVCKVNSLNIALKASLNLGNQWEYRFNEIFNQIFPYCAGFRVFSEIVRDCAALTELCGPAPTHPVRRPVLRLNTAQTLFDGRQTKKPSFVIQKKKNICGKQTKALHMQIANEINQSVTTLTTLHLPFSINLFEKFKVLHGYFDSRFTER